MSQRLSVRDIASRKGAAPIVCVTAYTAPMAGFMDPHVDLMLVGDSMGMVIYGMATTLGVTLEMSIAHGQAVMRAELGDGDQIGVGNHALKFFRGSSAEARYHQELIDLAVHDGLTGFFNRRHFRMLLDDHVVEVEPDHVVVAGRQLGDLVLPARVGHLGLVTLQRRTRDHDRHPGHRLVGVLVSDRALDLAKLQLRLRRLLQRRHARRPGAGEQRPA